MTLPLTEQAAATVAIPPASKANSGANSDITSLTGLTTALPISEGGTGATSAAAARTALGLGSAATKDVGTSGAAVPLLSTANTWGLQQTHAVRPTFNGNTPWDNGNLASPMTLDTDQTVTGVKTFTANPSVDGAAATYRNTSYSTVGVARWKHGANQTAETGNNVGSDYSVDRYTDAGVWIDAPISVKRSTGVTTFSVRPLFGANTPWDSGNLNFAAPPAIGATTPNSAKFTSLSTTAGVAAAGTIQSGPGGSSPTSYVTPTAVFSTYTGNTGGTDKYTEMWADNTTGGIWISQGSGFSKGLITATAAQIASGIPQILGRSATVLHAHWSGNTSAPNSGTAINCTATWLSTGRLRIWLSTAFAFATHSISVTGNALSNGTNWLVATMIGNAGDGTYIDIGFVITGSGAGVMAEGQIQLTVFKVN
jgi:hypothetical protein